MRSHRTFASSSSRRHQFPLGVAVSLRRWPWLRWAEEHDAAIIEDDYDSEFRFGGRPIEPLQSLDTTGRVVYPSFSKTMLPSMRLGFLVTPPSLRRALVAAKYVTDWATSTAPQAAMAEFIDRGWFARHLRRMRDLSPPPRDRVGHPGRGLRRPGEGGALGRWPAHQRARAREVSEVTAIVRRARADRCGSVRPGVIRSAPPAPGRDRARLRRSARTTSPRDCACSGMLRGITRADPPNRSITESHTLAVRSDQYSAGSRILPEPVLGSSSSHEIDLGSL